MKFEDGYIVQDGGGVWYGTTAEDSKSGYSIIIEECNNPTEIILTKQELESMLEQINEMEKG